MTASAISLITIGVADLAAATAFYERVGWRRSSVSNEEISFFDTGGPVLALFPVRDVAAETGEEPVPGPPPAGQVAFACNVHTVDEVATTVDTWLAAGARLIKPPSTAEWGGTSAYVADLDGHRWEIAHNPGFPLRADGTVRLPA